MVHILGAEELWLSRWMREQGRTLLNSDDFPNNDSLVKRLGDFGKLINYFLDSLTEDELVKEIGYKYLKGIPYSLELWKQMLHLINRMGAVEGNLIPGYFLSHNALHYYKFGGVAFLCVTNIFGKEVPVEHNKSTLGDEYYYWISCCFKYHYVFYPTVSDVKEK
ncbi:hypothetical protein Desaci_1355 [Desulfosporosinus acidiphilus SJ4]|uniref:Uncharacterized protein n=1 Tax=Desulfosporosinus acidiphilus (strain DSM 22704 / JCM 16185 / SJ4) TaxID=646529 RepID=I4D3K6_DESAJ|nr:hypothetical protein [Desulfosporosinus acidiphilus]AFM40380.1 hypothetical protein Desaci_1355 [Desulfosporosinus acidiphilus SJ4]